jgi:hypothetical protein
MEHLEGYLDAPNAALDSEMLDRIDAIVAPATVVDPHDWSVISPARHNASLRRRV